MIQELKRLSDGVRLNLSATLDAVSGDSLDESAENPENSTTGEMYMS